jgi:glutathione S-transferase
MSEGLVLYRALATRSFTALWMLEELRVPYRSEIVGVEDRRNAYLALNPTGMVPTLADGPAVVREAPAICMYLADRYSYGGLAPRIEAPTRGAYLSWLVYATAQLEPAQATQSVSIPAIPGMWGPGWEPLPQVIGVLAQALEGRPYLLGDQFSAADVMVGSALIMRLHTQEVPPEPVLVAYAERLGERAACKRAGELNWPASSPT